MALTDGQYRLGPEQGRLLVKTSRTGLGRKAGHDLTLEVTRWSADAVIDTGDPRQSSVTATIEAGSLEVREGTGGVKPLTDSDRADIRKTIQEKVLDTARNPEITFSSTEVTGKPESFTITGDLTIRGKTQPASVQASAGNGRIRGGATVTQSKWGIKPYSAFAGMLRLADDVQIEFDLTEPG